MTAPDPSSVLLPGPWTHRSIAAHGIRLHVAELPPAPDAPERQPVVLLHGFAGLWYSWRHQLISLAAAGHPVVAADLRGYGDSDKPPRGYDAWTLAGDIGGLIRSLGRGPAAVVGHGDGGTVAFTLSAVYPDLVSAIVTVGCAHPLDLRHALLHERAQRAAVLPHVLTQQLPRLPEARLRRADGALVETLLRERSGPDWPHTDDFAETARVLRSAIQIPKVAHLACEFRRWLGRSRFRPDGARHLRVMRRHLDLPALAVVGELDPYVLPGTVADGRGRVPDTHVVTLPGVGHHPHQEDPDGFSTLLVDWLAALA